MWGTKARDHSNNQSSCNSGLSRLGIQLGMVLLRVPDLSRAGLWWDGAVLAGHQPDFSGRCCCRERRSCKRSMAQARNGTRTVGTPSW